jgi:hypothetical protein
MVEYLSIATVVSNFYHSLNYIQLYLQMDELLERRFRDGDGVIVLGSIDPPAHRAVPNVIIDLCDSDDEDDSEQPEQDTTFAHKSDSDEDMHVSY